ncbi:MAG TPA: sugar transferase [Candidatus Dormibacteraeota bacterium]|nr:sugar transferase [Candidatus Dormibacteraeota bacterium]
MAEPGPVLRPLELASGRRRNPGMPVVVALRVLGDALAVVGAGLAAYEYRFYLSGIPIPGQAVPPFGPYVRALPAVVAIWVLTFAATGRYRVRRGESYVDEVLGAIGAAALTVVLVLAAEGAAHGFPYSRLVLADAFVLAGALFLAERGLIRVVQAALLRGGHGRERALVVGSGMAARVLVQRLRMFPEYGYGVVGVVQPGPVSSPEAAGLPPGVPVFSLDASLPRLLARERVDAVFLALGGGSHDRTLELARVCAAAGATVKLVPDVLEIMTSAAVAEEVGGLPVVGVRPTRLAGHNVAVKRAFDVVATALLGIVVVPLVAILAVAVRLTSRGPAFYRQERLGQGGRTFHVWKLRSMVADAEAETGPVMTDSNDARRTAVGRFLRRFSLDELPQLWNVIVGEMSLVGPRPERPYFAHRFAREVPRYGERLEVLPGCTGWAQVNDLRQGTSIEERTLYDLYYAENWSLGLDFKILLMTPWRLLVHRHAY